VSGIRTRSGRLHLLVSPPQTPGRRRAVGPVRRLPDGFSRLTVTWAAKAVAAVGVLGGAAVALALPVDASPASLTLAVPTATTSVARADAPAASRSLVRSAIAPAVAAPEGAAPIVPEQVGVSGVKAVAKPKPKPKPKPVPQATKAANGTKAAQNTRAAKAPKAGKSSRSSSAAAPKSSYSTKVSGRCAGIGVNNNGERLCSAVDSVFHLGTIGGYRSNAGEHSTGQAIDFMISSKSQGDGIAAWVQAHVGQFDVKYLIWRQRYWEPGRGWKQMEDRGSPTANHFDHVHVTVNP
jgi:hypothetical protein